MRQKKKEKMRIYFYLLINAEMENFDWWNLKFVFLPLAK